MMPLSTFLVYTGCYSYSCGRETPSGRVIYKTNVYHWQRKPNIIDLFR